MTNVFNSPLPPNLRKNMVFLVVDDLDTMRKITVNQLRMLGADKILSARDGLDAMRILKSQYVDVVLSDWNMPVMSGLELLKTMRADPRLRSIPLIMITAEAERQRVEQALAADVTSMILKPYTPAQLMNRIEKAADWRPRAVKTALATAASDGEVRAAQKAAAPKEPERPTLLLVDDTPDNLMLLSQLLRDEYRVRLAQNGAKALEICASDNPPDLVLLDIMMPGMDGFEVAQRMREHPNSESIPVIFVTAMTDTDARIKGMDLGAVDFITKPIDPGVLKPRVRNFMRYVQMRKDMQFEFDSMVENARLRDHVEHMTRHDLKGPLSGVIGLVQDMLTSDGDLNNRQLEQLRLVEETALQVVNMVNLSSELLKIETKSFVLTPQPVPVADILRRMAEVDRITYASKQLTISVDTDTPVGCDVPQAMGDAMLCYSIFQNLLKNACEAAPANSTISIRQLDQSPLQVVIRNQGAVPAEIRGQFFDKFVTHGKPGGTGLGTYSAKLLTEAQGGQIDLAVDDEHNTTTITVRLPRRPS